MATVWIPSLMRDLSGGREQVSVPGATVGEVVDALERACPGIKARLCERDRLAPGLAVAPDGKVARLGLLATVDERSEVRFLPAIAGG